MECLLEMYSQQEIGVKFVRDVLPAGNRSESIDWDRNARRRWVSRHFFHPQYENKDFFDELLGCNIGHKAFVVSGGQVKIKGMPSEDFPAWTRVEKTVRSIKDIVVLQGRMVKQTVSPYLYKTLRKQIDFGIKTSSTYGLSGVIFYYVPEQRGWGRGHDVWTVVNNYSAWCFCGGWLLAIPISGHNRL